MKGASIENSDKTRPRMDEAMFSSSVMVATFSMV
jgi:hypothetical protein